MRISALAFYGMFGLLMLGCNDAVKVDGDGTYPTPLHIEVRLSATESRHALYRLESDGTLYFGGGREVLIGESKPAGTLTHEQRRTLWQIVDKYNLFEADSTFFGKGKEIDYDVKLRAGGKRRNFKTYDDKAKGLAELTAKLDEYQKELRYGKVTRLIDERVNRAGGKVKKQD